MQKKTGSGDILRMEGWFRKSILKREKLLSAEVVKYRRKKMPDGRLVIAVRQIPS
jgi:hypothetical protein